MLILNQPFINVLSTTYNFDLSISQLVSIRSLKGTDSKDIED